MFNKWQVDFLKLDSLVECLDEMQIDVCMITETWLKNDQKVEQELQDFSDKHGYSFIRRDRACGRRGGGVAICYAPARIQMSRIKLPPTKNEIIAAIGRRVGQRRKIAVIAVYLPPAMRADQIRRCLKDTNDSILHIKHK